MTKIVVDYNYIQENSPEVLDEGIEESGVYTYSSIGLPIEE